MVTKQAIAKKQVTFTCRVNNQAKTAYLAGDFNDWQPKVKKMTKGKNDAFQLKMKLAPGEYRYKFVVDGVWFDDPQAKEQIRNPYGTLNSIIRVE